MKLLAVVLVAASLAAATDYVEFSVVERIRFSVPGDWPVIASKSTADKTVFAFQIPNNVDEGTSDSSNLVITSVYLKNANDRDAFQKRANADQAATEKKLVEGWRCASFSANQKSTEYVIWDCYRIVADCGLWVRIAWPHLPKNPTDYDVQMETVLSEFLLSVAPSKPLPK